MNRIKHTYILDDPFDDPPQLSELIPGASPEGKPKDEVFTNRCYNLLNSYVVKYQTKIHRKYYILNIA